MSTQPLYKIADKSRDSVKSLPSIIHLFLFVTFATLAVLSINFEVFRVIRFGDLFIIIFALMIGVQWYGQRMMESGYEDGLKTAAEKVKASKSK
jgi:hypothetical protein